MEMLSLKPEHLSVLFSIERLALYEDIDRSRAVDRREKEKWFDRWSENLSDDCDLLNRGQVKRRIEELVARDGDTWKALVLIELARFAPYDLYRFETESENPEGGPDSSIKRTKRPKFDSTILEELWRDISGDSDESPVQQTAKALNKNASVLNGSRARKIVGAAGTAAVAVATGGAAFTLAPVIAPLIAGSAVAGLSGAQADMKPETIERIRQGLLNQIERTEIQQEVLSMHSENKDLDKAEKKEIKKELSGLKKSLGYMHNCEKELAKLIDQKNRSKKTVTVAKDDVESA